jgi:hypothetical protein
MKQDIIDDAARTHPGEMVYCVRRLIEFEGIKRRNSLPDEIT